jgi:hypothetical protein
MADILVFFLFSLLCNDIEKKEEIKEIKESQKNVEYRLVIYSSSCVCFLILTTTT